MKPNPDVVWKLCAEKCLSAWRVPHEVKVQARLKFKKGQFSDKNDKARNAFTIDRSKQPPVERVNE